MSTEQFRSSPTRAKQHYSHLTYAVRRRKETDTDEAQAMSSKARPLVQDTTERPPDLPRLKAICGYAISEDGQLMSRFVSPPRFGPNSLDQSGASAAAGNNNGSIRPVLSPGSIASPQRVFTATVTTGEGGVPRISIPLQATTNRAAVAAAKVSSSSCSSGKEEAWVSLVDAAAVDGLDEDDVALLEWNTVVKLLKHYSIFSATADDPIERARCELTWRRKHDRVVFAAQEQQQQQSKRGPSSSPDDEMQRAANEFRALVDRLYPPPPIMQAAGGPVLLVRTAPQGEIHINPNNSSPRNPAAAAAASAISAANNLVYGPVVHLRKTAAAHTAAADSLLGASHHRPFGVRHVAQGPESSPPRSASRSRVAVRR